MNFRPNGKSSSYTEVIDVTSMIDVVFVILIFFMLTTTFSHNTALKVALPTATNATSSTDENKLDLLIDGQGRYYVNGREVLNNQPETLFQAMTLVLNEMDKTPPLVISADAGVPYQSVVTAMDIAGRLGLTQVSLATTQTERKK